MPLLTEEAITEEATTAEEPVVEQQFVQPEQDVVTTEYLSTSTNSTMEEQVEQELSKLEQELPEVGDDMYNHGSQLIFVNVPEDQSSLGVVTEGDTTNQAQELE